MLLFLVRFRFKGEKQLTVVGNVDEKLSTPTPD